MVIFVLAFIYYLYYQETKIPILAIELPEKPKYTLLNINKMPLNASLKEASPSFLNSEYNHATMMIWTILIGTFQDKITAQAVLKQLKTENMMSYLKKMNNQYTVFVGVDLNKEFLSKQLQILQEKCNITGEMMQVEYLKWINIPDLNTV
ncbi:MAG: SPOR domain-containing protein [Endozoicomonadaceae bacterium]|nr:SPOR domain-containing protein [Endozoicomonadaceae bacterium]